MAQTMRRIVGPSFDLTNYSYKNIPNGAGKIIVSVARDFGNNSIEIGNTILAPTIVCPNISVPGLVINGMEGEMKKAVDEQSIAVNIRASDAHTKKLTRHIDNIIKSMEEKTEITGQENKEITEDKEQEGTRMILPDITR